MEYYGTNAEETRLQNLGRDRAKAEDGDMWKTGVTGWNGGKRPDEDSSGERETPRGQIARRTRAIGRPFGESIK